MDENLCISWGQVLDQQIRCVVSVQVDSLVICCVVSVQADSLPRCEPLIMQDMPMMAQFVYDLYRDKIRQLAAQQMVKLLFQLN